MSFSHDTEGGEDAQTPVQIATGISNIELFKKKLIHKIFKKDGENVRVSPINTEIVGYPRCKCCIKICFCQFEFSLLLLWPTHLSKPIRNNLKGQGTKQHSTNKV